jgi:hypothetical protein
VFMFIALIVVAHDLVGRRGARHRFWLSPSPPSHSSLSLSLQPASRH